MKKLLILVVVLSVSANICLQAQCYEPNLRKADAEYAKGNYSQAYEYYSRATKCPDASRFENGKAAKAGMRKCKPSLLLDGKDKVEFHCGPEAGSKTLKVSYSKLTGWYVCGGKNNCTVDSVAGTVTYTWSANNSVEDRKLSFHIHGNGGSESCGAYFYLYQAGWPDSTATLKPGEKYDTMIKGDDGITFVVFRGKCGYIDSLGNEITPLKYDYEKGGGIYPVYTGYQKKWYKNIMLVRVKRKGKYGFIDIRGREVIPLIYDSVYSTSINYGFSSWPVKRNHLWGLIDGNGKEIIKCEYEYIQPNHEFTVPNEEEPIAFSHDGINYALFDRNGTQLTPFNIQDIGVFPWNGPELARVKINGKYGYINKQGEITIQPQFKNAHDFSLNRAAVELDGKHDKIGFINTKGNLVIPCVYDLESIVEKHNHFCLGINLVKKNGLWGIIDTMGNVIADFKYSNWVNRDYGWGLYYKLERNKRTYYVSMTGDEYESEEALKATDTSIYLKAAGIGILRGQEVASTYYWNHQDSAKSFYWMKMAAQSGNPTDQMLLAKKYYYGNGVMKSLPEAYNWFEKAANAGDGEAMRYLAWMLWYGQGCEKNRQRAEEWGRKAIRAGNSTAFSDMKKLGMKTSDIKPF